MAWTQSKPCTFCNYGVNPNFVSRFEAAGVRIAGLGDTGELRAVELPEHRFYVATLFHPQLESQPGRPSPFVTAYVSAARAFAGEAQSGEMVRPTVNSVEALRIE